MKEIILSKSFQGVDIDPRDCEILEKFYEHSWSFQDCYKVLHKPSNKLFTMKQNHLDSDIEASYIYSFKRHARFLRKNKFSFKYIQPVVSMCLSKELESKDDNGYYYYICSFKEYVSGACLPSVYSVGKEIKNPLDLHVLAKIAVKILIILDELHSMHRCHGNLVPSNIIIRPNGDIMLIDKSVPGFDYGANPDYDPPWMSNWYPPFIPYDGRECHPNAKWDIYQLGLTLLDCFLGGIDLFYFSDYRFEPKTLIDIIKKQGDYGAAEEMFFDFVYSMILLDAEAIPCARDLLQHPFIQYYINKDLNRESLRLHKNIPHAKSLNFPSLQSLCVTSVIEHKINYHDRNLPRPLLKILEEEMHIRTQTMTKEISARKREEDIDSVEFPSKTTPLAGSKLVERLFSSVERNNDCSSTMQITSEHEEASLTPHDLGSKLSF